MDHFDADCFLPSVNANLMRTRLIRINLMRIKCSSVNATLRDYEELMSGKG